MINLSSATEQRYLAYVALKQQRGYENILDRKAWVRLHNPNIRDFSDVIDIRFPPYIMPGGANGPPELSHIRLFRPPAIGDFFNAKIDDYELKQHFRDAFHQIRQFNIDIGLIPEDDKTHSTDILTRILSSFLAESTQYARNETARMGEELARTHANRGQPWVYFNSDLVLLAERATFLMHEAFNEIASELNLDSEELRSSSERWRIDEQGPTLGRIIAGDGRFFRIRNNNLSPPAGFSFFYTASVSRLEQTLLVGENIEGKTVFTMFRKGFGARNMEILEAIRLAERLNPRLNFSRFTHGVVNAFDFFNDAKDLCNNNLNF